MTGIEVNVERTKSAFAQAAETVQAWAAESRALIEAVTAAVIEADAHARESLPFLPPEFEWVSELCIDDDGIGHIRYTAQPRSHR
jgi:hypothetical protein